MSLYDYRSILKDVPLFAGLADRDLRFIRERSQTVEFKKGQTIYKEGSDPSFFYLILRGRVVISALDAEGRQNVLEYLHRGKYFGIISMLTSEPHSVTAKALNDCALLTIGRKDFDLLLKKIPPIAVDLSRTLSRRLKRKDSHPKSIFESTIIAVMSSLPQVGKTLYASNLAFSLSKETHKSIVILDICPKEKIHRMPGILTHGGYKVCELTGKARLPGFSRILFRDRYGIDLAYLTYSKSNQAWPRNVVDILSSLVNDYHYIILDLPCCREQTVLSILNQADIIHILTSPRTADLKSTARLIRKLEGEFRFPRGKIKVIVNQKKTRRTDSGQRDEALGHPVFATLPPMAAAASGRLVLEKPAADYSRVIKRISRQEGDRLIGLALGVGVAYGFCHIGVLKVIEEEKIPIDIVSGSSMGAVIAALWATGNSSAEIQQRLTKEFREPTHIWSLLDFTFPLLGFVKGDKLYRFLKRQIGNATFRDVKVPLKIVASEVKRKESRVLDQGTIVDAVMASCAMPGVFTPFRLNQEMLFDGGVINPLPTEPLLEAGAKKIIAVNVTPSREDILSHYEELKESLSGKKPASWFRIKDYLKDKFKNNLLDSIFSSFEIMQSEVARKEALLADVVLHPDLTGMHWLELHRSAEFARKGEEEARRNLDRIWKVINE
ncbi:MAG: patatin-like phospholipase family protein [Deltaproteobacteria bacterium]